MTVRLRCGSCSVTLSVPDSKIGQIVTCPRCGVAVVAADTPKTHTDDGGFIPGDDDAPAAPRPTMATVLVPPQPSPSFDFDPPVALYPDERPWFYGFLVFLAYVTIVACSAILWVGVALQISHASRNLQPNETGLFTFFMLVGAMMAQLIILTWPALVLLFVDIGGSLRDLLRKR